MHLNTTHGDDMALTTYSVECTTNMHMSIQTGMVGARYPLRRKLHSWKLRPNVTLNWCYCIVGHLVRC